MIQHYYPKQINSGDESGALWVYVENPSKAEQHKIVEEYGVLKHFIHDALDAYEIPRVESHDDSTYIFTRFAYQSEGGNVNTAPILFVLRANQLITVCKAPLPELSSLIETGEHALTGNFDPALLILNILLEIDSQYDLIINANAHRIHRLRSRLGKRDIGVNDFIGFVTLEDDLNDFLNSLEPTNATLRHLVSNHEARSFTPHTALVNTVILNNEQSIQACNANLKSLAAIRRTYSLIASHNLDRTIKILTTVSVLISIPTMFFSMYGMNVELPGQKAFWAFTVVFIVSLTVSWTAYLVGRKKHIF